MIFCVSPDPYYKIHGSSSEKMGQLFHELRNIGIGGVNVTYEDPDEYPGWKEYMQNTANHAKEFAFRVSMHAPGGDISSIDRATRESAVARLGKSIRDVGQVLSDVIVVVHPENANPDRQPGEGNIDFESFYNVVEESGYDGMVQLEVKMKEGDEPMEFYLRNYQHFISMILRRGM